MIGLERLLAAEDDDDDEEEEEEEAEGEAYLRHLALRQAGELCPDIDGEPCWYCEDDGYGYRDWEGYSQEEPGKGRRAWSAAQGTFCGFKKFFLCKPPSAPDPPACSGTACPLVGIVLPQKQQLTAEEAERNAEELVAEEERIKRKAEKKRQKKKRQKDRKRQEKHNQELKSKSDAAKSSHGRDVDDRGSLAAVPSATGAGLPDSEGDSTEASPGRNPSGGTEEMVVGAAAVEEELDLSSSFVSKALLKLGTKPLLPRKEKAAKPDAKEAEGKVKPEVPRTGPQMTAVEQSMVLADCGNETAKQGRYQEAVLLFTEAVKLNPQEYRFFGNRSFCYERLQCYAEALRDAQLALSLRPGWPKGLFRQGKALMGLKRYAEAARTFQELLRLEDFRSDAAIQLRRCQVHCLLENSFGGCLPRWNILPRDSLPPLPGEQHGRRPVTSSSAQAGGRMAPFVVTSSQGKPSTAQAPAREWFAVWVGNLTPGITQEVLLRYFRPFGPIDSIRRLPRRFCAFINYTRQEAAEAAYAALQGVEVEGSRLVLQLKHPVHATPPHTKAPGRTQQPLEV